MKEKLDLNRMHRTILAARGGSMTTAKILDHVRVNDHVEKVVVRITNSGTKEDMRAAVSKALNGQATVIESTFLEVAHETYVGYVAHNPEVKEFSKADQAAVEARTSSMRVVAKNLLLDETDQSLWEARESAGGKFLVRTSKEDLSELLSSVAQPSLQVPTKRMLSTVHAEFPSRSYAQFLERDLAEVGYGYILEATDSTVKVLAFGADEEPMEIPASDIIQVADLEGEDTEQAAIEIPAAAADASKLKKYFQQLYGKVPQFMQKLNKVIQDGTKF